MSDCYHKNLVLIKEPLNKLRCKKCHLTITKEELGDHYCPECFDSTGNKNYDFEKISLTPTNTSQYRCEDCGISIKTKA